MTEPDGQLQGQLELPLDIVREWPAEPDDEQAQPAPVDPVDVELGRIIGFIDEMPTWYDPQVIAVQHWLIEQLRALAHRRVLP